MFERQENISLAFAGDHAIKAQDFFKLYTQAYGMTCPDHKLTGLKDKKERVCRFCKKGMPDVTFKKEAHVFSQLLGNRYLVSDFECDTCNEIFGRYENDLAIFLGPLTAFQGIKGKKSLKTFKSADNRLRVDEIMIKEGIPGVCIAKTDPNDPSITITKTLGETAITYQKGAYTPLRVYKALLKMALCCLPDSELVYYQNAINYLLTEKLEDNLQGAQYITIHRKPYTFGDRAPVSMIFRKNDSMAKLPTHIFVLLFANVYYQFFIPLHSEDIALLYNQEGIDRPPVCPPFYSDIETAKTTPSTTQTRNLSSIESVKGEMEKVLLQTTKESLEQVDCYDPATDTHSHASNFDEVVKIYMAREESDVTLDDLVKAVQNNKNI